MARLDRDQLMRQREREQAALAQAEAQLAQAETALEWQRQTLAAIWNSAAPMLSPAQARLRELKNGARPQEIQEAQAAVAGRRGECSARGKIGTALKSYTRDDDISTSQFDQFRSRFETRQRH